jgi:hypothetical protein
MPEDGRTRKPSWQSPQASVKDEAARAIVKETRMVIEFLLSELDTVESKVRRLLRTVAPEPAEAPDVDRARRMLDYHAMQARLIWGLMKATGGEIESVFERHACYPGRGVESESGRGRYADGFSRNEKELEVVVELSKRWGIWCAQYRNGCRVDFDCAEARGEAVAGDWR